jgi:excisionase family DNA binding protein
MRQTQFDLLTVKEAAAALRISRATMYRLIDAGEVRRVRVTERCVRVKRLEVERYLERRARMKGR